MPSTFSQAFPPAPTFTEKNVGSLEGRVFIVTGAASGVGYELARLLYRQGGDVYVAARSSEKVDRAIKDIKSSVRSSKGHLSAMILDLADFPTIEQAVNKFHEKENRLDVLVHNAGVMTPPAGSKSNAKKGYDLEMATNCMGPFILNRLLEPILIRTAHAERTPDSVRIVWLSSMIGTSVPPGGIQFSEKSGSPKVLKNTMQNYMQSKVGNVFLASEAAKRLGGDDVISMSVNPGLMKTELQRHSPKMQSVIMGILFKPPIFGAYSELFAALSPKIKAKHNGGFVVPWGRFGDIPDHIAEGLKPKAEGGSGAAEKFWTWCERETEPYLGSEAKGN